MKRPVRLFLSMILWVMLFAYLLFAARLCNREKAQIHVDNVEIRITDAGKINVVTPDMVAGWLEEEGYDFEEAGLDTVDTEDIRKLIAGKTFVKSARVYTDMEGVIHIDVSQRRPVMRVNTANGYNFYVSDDNWILPVPVGGAMYVPVVTGNFRMPFGQDYYGSLEAAMEEDEKKVSQNYAFMLKLINFVRLTAVDSFWNSQIVQIVVTQKGAEGDGARWKEPEIEIIPRAGDFVVGLGTLVDVRKKLDNLLLFYRNVLSYEGWDNYRYINLKYDGQVVCTK